MKRLLSLIAVSFFAVACGGKPPPIDMEWVYCMANCSGYCEKIAGTWVCIPNIPPPPPPEECKDDLKILALPWCHETVPPMFCGECKHHPPGEECPVKAPKCDDSPPPPPPPPPPEGDCKLGTPKASETSRAEFKIQRQSKMIVTGTPVGEFGAEYYCTEEMNWPEACAGGRTHGPVAPDGHPQRLACEQQYMEQPCPTYSATQANGHISFDPWFALGPDKINQNHPKNVEAGCGKQFEDHESWVKEESGGHLYIQSGMWLVATIHGDTKVKGCIANGVICGVSKFRVNN